jgi:hypothetical protein
LNSIFRDFFRGIDDADGRMFSTTGAADDAAVRTRIAESSAGFHKHRGKQNLNHRASTVRI